MIGGATEDTRSEARFRQLTDGLPQLVWTCDADGRCDYLSRQWLAYTGLTEAAQRDYGWLDSVHPDDRTELMRRWSECVRSSTPLLVEFRLRSHDGEYRWFDTRATPLVGADGRVVRWFGASTDITDQRRTAEALRTSEERLQTVIANMTEGLVICELDGQLLHWNPAGLAMHGFASLDECLVKLPEFAAIFELATLDGALVPYDEWPLPRIFRGEMLEGLELRLSRRDVAWERVFAYSGSIVNEPNGRRVAFLTISDRTASKRAAGALEESEARLRLANEAAGIGSYDTDLCTGVARLSPEIYDILGVPPGEPPPLERILDSIHPDDRQIVTRHLTEDPSQPYGGRIQREVRVVRDDGEVRWVNWSGRTFFEETERGYVPVRAVGACFDVTDRRRAERRLAMQNDISRALADAATLGEAAPKIVQTVCDAEGWDLGAIWEIDERSGRLRCSDVWYRPEASLSALADATRALELARGAGLPGRVWATGQPLVIPDVALDARYLRAALAAQQGLRSALGFPIVEGGEVTGVVDFIGRSMRHGAIPLDLFTLLGRELGGFLARRRAEAERERLAAGLRQAQKMEAVGQLSGGIAHDFNNILAAIVGNTQLALRSVPADAPVAELLQEIAEASGRATDLVKRIMTFARRQPLARRVIPLSAVVDESARLLRATLPAGVELAVSCARDAPNVLGDPTQLHQVIVNLATNAWHAIDHDRGRIELAVDAVVVDAAAAQLLHTRPGRFVRLAVRDNGVGMDAATVERIFEPFFTTKESSQGTGLGLSVVHGIVRDHEGAIQVTSAPGEGAEFALYFPAVHAPASVEPVARAPVESGLGQLVMYVDDEVALVKVTKTCLRELGYHVDGFTDAAAALEAFEARPDAYALVLSDMNMPGISGLSFLERVLSLRPDVPAILISGSITEGLRAEACELGVRRLLYKPCSFADLGAAVREALQGAPPRD